MMLGVYFAHGILSSGVALAGGCLVQVLQLLRHMAKMTPPLLCTFFLGVLAL